MKKYFWITWIVLSGLAVRLWQLITILLAVAVIAMAIYKVVTGDIIHFEMAL